MHPDQEPVADTAMDAKMRELWAKFAKRKWVQRQLQACLPPTRVQSMGCEFIVHPRDNFTELQMWRTQLPPEHEATQAIAERLAGTNPVIVDVGANAGAFFLPVLKSAGDGARALVFEPNPVMRKRLEVNIGLNRFENVQVFDCAVSDENTTSRMHFPQNGNLGEGRIEFRYPNVSEEMAATEVAVRPLGDCLLDAGITKVDLLKVDVEGLEDRVIVPLLEAGSPVFPRLIYAEVAHRSHWKYPLLEVLKQKNYMEIQAFDKNNRLFEHGA